MIIYLLINTLFFYLLPLIIKSAGSGMFVLLLVLPLIIAFSSFIYGFKHQKRNYIYSLIITLIFVPTIFIYYNSSAFIYVPIYLLISLAFNYTGKAFKKYLFTN